MNCKFASLLEACKELEACLEQMERIDHEVAVPDEKLVSRYLSARNEFSIALEEAQEP